MTAGFASSTRHRTARLIGLAVVAFVALDLLITGMGSPPSNIPALVLDDNTGVPPVPTNADFPYIRDHNIVAIALLGSLGVIGILISLREALAKRNPMPLMLSIGTVIVVVPEVFFDVIGMVYYPTDSTDNAFDLFGRQMGWFIIAGWAGAGAFAAMMLKTLMSRPTAKQIWLVMLATAVSYTIFEELLVGAGGMYHYYGNQPMWWNNLPLWWTPCNAIGVALLPAAFAYRYQAILTGWRSAAMLLVVPASAAGAYAIIAMPSWIVVNGDYPWLVTELAGLSTWALGIGLIAVIMNLFLGYQPFQADHRGILPPGVKEPTQAMPAVAPKAEPAPAVLR